MKMHLSKTLLTVSCLVGSGLAFAGDTLPSDQDLHEQRDTRKEIGFIGGAIIGGAVAGPPGAIAMAFVGALIGDNRSSLKEKEVVETNLTQLNAQYATLEQENGQLQLAFEDLERTSFEQASLASITDSAPCCFDTELVLHFQSSSSEVEPHYLDQLDAFAALVKANPDAVIQMTGYSDQRGESDINLNLSQDRLASVESALQQMGLDPGMLSSIAYGESRPLDTNDNLESMFFDRRVVLKATSPSSEYLSHIPE